MHAVFKAEDLFQKRKPSSAELHQSAKLYELLPSRANALWQSDVTYIHIPGHGWWYAVTVIDYYSRYLLALHLTPSYAAPEINTAIDHARAEAERLHGPLETIPFLVTDNGSSFLAKRFQAHIAGQFRQVRTRYRTPCIFWPIPITDSGLNRSSVLELSDHWFWFYSITFSGFPESVIGIQNP